MEKQIQIDDALLHYRIIGQGEPVVLLHGFAEDGSIWNNLVEYLMDDFLCIVPDLPGSGKSLVKNFYATSTEKFLSIDKIAMMMNSILENEQIEQAAILGHSMGGYIALAFAEKLPHKITKLGLLHSTSFADNKEKIETRKRGIQFINEYGGYAFLKQTIPNLFSEQYKVDNSSIVHDWIERGRSFSNEALINYYEAMIDRPDRTYVLAQCDFPMLFIIGRYDKAVSPDDSMQQSSIPKTSFVTILENTAHMGMLEEKEKFNASVKQFLLF